MTDRIAQVSLRMIQYFGSDVRRINHALKVHGFAVAISAEMDFSAQTSAVLQAAALLHDIGIHNAERIHGSSAGNWQELEGPPVARELLAGLNVTPQELERICYLIGHHHSYPMIDGPDFQALIEADFLVNAYEDQMPKSSLEAVGRKYVRTPVGTRLLNQLYLYDKL